MEGRERSEQAPVVLGHGGTHSGEASAMAELADSAKRGSHRGSIDAEAGVAGAAEQSGARGSLEAATTRWRAS
jgi:hypothetical protein